MLTLEQFRRAKARRPFSLDENLQSIDALCNRWAEETWEYYGDDSAAITWVHETPVRSSLMGISNDTMALDQVLAKAEERYRSLVWVWYRGSGSVNQKAKRLGTNRADIYDVWRRTLEYLRGRLHAMNVNV